MKSDTSFFRNVCNLAIPVAGATMLSTLFRCMEKASLPLYASIAAAVINTGLNYALIFGKFGFPAMGARGVAVATVVVQLINFLIMFVVYFYCKKPVEGADRKAASVIIGKKLGVGDYEEAYQASRKLLYYGFAGSAILSVVILVLSPYYVNIFQVEEHVKMLTKQILFAYALVAPFKVENMILGGGILRSGGKTNYVMAIDLIGTWVFGVPLGLLAAFTLNLSIPYVYFILSLEEGIRFMISYVVLRRRKWMVTFAA